MYNRTAAKLNVLNSETKNKLIDFYEKEKGQETGISGIKALMKMSAQIAIFYLLRAKKS